MWGSTHSSRKGTGMGQLEMEDRMCPKCEPGEI